MNFLRNFRIGTRLSLGFGFLLVMLVGMSLLSLNRMSGIQTRLDDIVNVSNEQVRQANVMLVSINRSTAAGTEQLMVRLKGRRRSNRGPGRRSRGEGSPEPQPATQSPASTTTAMGPRGSRHRIEPKIGAVA